MSRSAYSRFEKGSGVRIAVDVRRSGQAPYHCDIHLSRTIDGKVHLSLANCTELKQVAVRCKEAGGEGSFRTLVAGVTNEFPLDFSVLEVNDQTPLHRIRKAVEGAFVFSRE
ncbi:MAG: hypothetical protein BWY43_00774 [candidate division WS2 bacterium ADurb.Bin280]|uniref:Uncharacterized protein n=1 Tax=candidate division WS2 bacterium ADurb.Bin280 TaxID=1852829 RepID=A0A1V5SBJ4_9BACT|nr:MAG: hypothetical protein BWY43_00774 [candidate division WS2 bacterium ADurb.Bin280]